MRETLAAQASACSARRHAPRPASPVFGPSRHPPCGRGKWVDLQSSLAPQYKSVGHCRPAGWWSEFGVRHLSHTVPDQGSTETRPQPGRVSSVGRSPAIQRDAWPQLSLPVCLPTLLERDGRARHSVSVARFGECTKPSGLRPLGRRGDGKERDAASGTARARAS